MTKNEFAYMRDTLGFDESTRARNGAVSVRCSQCEAVAINGTACHEHGCPNRSHKCRECGDTLRHGTECNCGEPIENDGLPEMTFTATTWIDTPILPR